jgi:hypothetical protein
LGPKDESNAEQSGREALEVILKKPTFFKAMRKILVLHTDLVDRELFMPLAASNSSFVALKVRRIVDSLFDADLQSTQIDDEASLPESTLGDQIRKTVSSTDDFSLPFSKMRLQLLFSSKRQGNRNENLVGSLFEAIESSFDPHNSTWVDLLVALDSGISQQVSYFPGTFGTLF